MPIRKDAKGQWHVEVCVNRQRIHRRCPEGASASDAKELEAALKASLKKRRVPKVPGNPLLTDLLGHYSEVYALTLRGWKEAQYHAYRIAPWCEGKRASDTRQVVAKIIDDMRGHYRPATINKSLNALSRALSLAWESGDADQDYSSVIKRLPERNARERVLSLDEVKKIAGHASEAVRAAVWITLYTGMRRSEVAKLRPEHIGDDTITIPAAMTKSYKTRPIPIAAPLRPWLKSVPLGLTAEGYKTGFVRARVKAGILDVTIHDLRRSCGTMLIQSGVDIYIVSKILGHSSVSVTQARYAFLAGDQLAEGIRKAFG